ncbi:MAG: ABC transporter permease, partial [Microbacterium sp.]
MRWRVAARIAQRQVRRTWLSSLLIVTLVALPIAGMAGASIFADSMMGTPAEKADAELGRMQGWVQPVGPPDGGLWQSPTNPRWYSYPTDADGAPIQPEGDAPADPLGALPAGTETVKISADQVRIETTGGIATVRAWAGPAWDERFRGRFDVVEGTAPTADDEVMVTPATLQRTGSRIGGALTVAGSGETYTITGTIDIAGVPAVDSAVVFRDADRFATASPRSDLGSANTLWFLPDLSLDWDDIQRLNAQGIVAYSREVVLDPPVFTTPDGQEILSPATQDLYARLNLLSALGAAGLAAAYLVVMLAGAAFAVSARRQQRALAIAASVGAD